MSFLTSLLTSNKYTLLVCFHGVIKILEKMGKPTNVMLELFS